MIDKHKIRGISLDLDDTLWPIWPTIERAERKLLAWMSAHAPMTAAMFSNANAMREIRDRVMTARPELKYDLSAVRREAIRMAMYRAGDDPLMADAAFEVFFAARHEVDFYSDAIDALARLSRRFPLVALSNGNADLARIDIKSHFKAAVSAKSVGVGKPHRAAFDAAAKALSLPNHAVLHVGDDLSLDVLGALSAGMQAVWINRVEAEWTAESTPPSTVVNLTELCELLDAH